MNSTTKEICSNCKDFKIKFDITRSKGETLCFCDKWQKYFPDSNVYPGERTCKDWRAKK